MRFVKILAVALMLGVILLAITLGSLVRSESGSAWLVQKGLALSPVLIELRGIRGTLADGLAADSLYINLPRAEIRGRDIVVSWTPAALLAGEIQLDEAVAAELTIDVVPPETPKPPPDDRLFWLKIPLSIYIESGQLDSLRIEAAEFTNLRVQGEIGQGRLLVEHAAGEIAGITLEVAGELEGPEPGRLVASGGWNSPQLNLAGRGEFNGDIHELAVSHVLEMPDPVLLEGTIFDLFSAPRLAGVATWGKVRLPGATPLYASSGSFTVESDFRTAQVAGDTEVLLADWPAAPLELSGNADLQGFSIDAYRLATFGGQVTGAGRINYRDGISGQLAINARELDTQLLNENVTGRLSFESQLQLESLDEFALRVASARALLGGKEMTGQGNVRWRAGQFVAVAATADAGANSLVADISGEQQLTGSVRADLPVLAALWPGLQGSADIDLNLRGSRNKPQIKLYANAAALAYKGQSLDALDLSLELLANEKIAASLSVDGIALAERELGQLDVSVKGKLNNYKSSLALRGDIADIQLAGKGGWDGQSLQQTLEEGVIKPQGFDSWKLNESPQLSLSGDGGTLEPHCWQQAPASICVESSQWDARSQQSRIIVKDFAMASLQPLLAEGYSIDGTANGSVLIDGNEEGLRGEVHWLQDRTVLGYSDDIDSFSTVLNEIRLDLVSDDMRTDLNAAISGADGLTLQATALVDGPLLATSPVSAAINGDLPSVGLLRPLVQRVVNPGEMQGALRVDLAVGGTLGDPVFDGGVYLQEGVFGLLDLGITLRDINIAAESRAADKLAITGQLRSGDGKATLVGAIRSETDDVGKARLVADVKISGDSLASVRMPDLSLDASPDLQLRISQDLFDITGVVLIPSARARIRELPRGAVARSSDVVVHAPERLAEEDTGTIVTGDLEIVLGEDVRFDGFGLDSRLEGSMRLRQQRGGYLRASGTVRVRDGFLTGYGKELRVDRGDLTFTGPLDDPLINIQVSRESIYEGRQYTIGLRLSGSAQNVRTEPFSRPSMSENDVLSFLLLDQPVGSGGGSGAALALGLQQLVPGESGVLGLDEVSFETNDANQAAMVAGKRINDRLYVRYVFGSLGEPGAFRIRYRLGRGFSLEASTGSRQALDLIYLLER